MGITFKLKRYLRREFNTLREEQSRVITDLIRLKRTLQRKWRKNILILK